MGTKLYKQILREVPPEQADFRFFFENDGLTGASGDYCNNLFIVSDGGGFNREEYDSLYSQLEELVEMYKDVINNEPWATYESVEEMLADQGLDESFEELLKDCLDKDQGFWRKPEEFIAEYLTLTTGKEWELEEVHGYSQGEHVYLIYCKERYQNARIYGEVWLGMAKEFVHIDGDLECYGYIVADSQVRRDEDYKEILCEWIGLDPNETVLELIDEPCTTYRYRTI